MPLAANPSLAGQRAQVGRAEFSASPACESKRCGGDAALAATARRRVMRPSAPYAATSLPAEPPARSLPRTEQPVEFRRAERAATRGSSLPAVAQLAQLHEHRLFVGRVRQIRKCRVQARDHRRTPQPEEGVNL